MKTKLKRIAVAAISAMLAAATYAANLAPGQSAVESAEVQHPEAMPGFEKTEYEFKLYKGFKISEVFEIRNQQAKTVTLKEVGKGKLPVGLKLKYDKKSGKVLLSGSPTRDGEYEYTVHIEERVGRENRVGPNVVFRFTVRDIAKLTPDDRDYNFSFGKKIKLTMPLWSESYHSKSYYYDWWGRRVDARAYEGMLTVSVTARGAIFASVKGLVKRTLSFKGNWQNVNNGDVYAELASKSGERLEVFLYSNGMLEACLHDVDGHDGKNFKTDLAAATPTAADYALYAGTTVIGERCGGEGISGKVTISKNGKVSYKGFPRRVTVGLLLDNYGNHSAQLFFAGVNKWQNDEGRHEKKFCVTVKISPLDEREVIWL